MYTDQYNSSATTTPSSSYYLDSFPYTSYNTNAYAFRQQNQANVYFSTVPTTTTTTTNQFNINHSDMINYTNYESTYLNVAAVATNYQNPYYSSNAINDPFDLNFSRHINEDLSDRKISTTTATTTVQTNKKRKFQDDTMKSQCESELCRVCDDVSSGYHFGVFTCEACKGFFRRYSKKSTILEPCPIRCCINKNNRNNCAACRFDKCKCVGMALDKIRFGKPPKIFRSSSLTTSSVKLEPNNNDFQLMLKLLECYQSFEEYDQQTMTTANTHSSIIFQFCHRLVNIVMQENECIPEVFFARLKRHESAIKFLITGENERNSSSWSKEPQAWIFAHNERWRLIMILLILAFDDEQIGGSSSNSNNSSSLDINENLYHTSNDAVIDRILRLFELECDQEKEARIYSENINLINEKNFKYMKAQFVLRFVDMMTNDMISNRIYSSNTIINPYVISDDNLFRSTNQLIYLSSTLSDDDHMQPTRIHQSNINNNCHENL